jgi:hypothetical protein
MWGQPPSAVRRAQLDAICLQLAASFDFQVVSALIRSGPGLCFWVAQRFSAAISASHQVWALAPEVLASSSLL